MTLGAGVDGFVATLPTHTLGAGVDGLVVALPGTFQGPGFQHTATAPVTTVQGPGIQHTAAAPTLSVQGPGLQHTTTTPLLSDVVIESITVIQRDTAQSFLVDVEFTIYEVQSLDQEFTLEWKKGVGGTYAPMTPQPFDRRHDAVNPLVLIPASSPGKTFNFVWQAFFDLPEGVFTDIFVRLTVGDGIGLPHTYAGVAPIPASIDEAFVEGLTNSVQGTDKAISVPGVTWTAAEYIWVAFPSAFNPTQDQDFLISVLGLGFPGAFVLAANSILISTPESGAPPISYDVWRSAGAGLGLVVDLDVTA